MLTHIVNKTNRDRYARYLEEMFRQRKRVFIDRLSWSGLKEQDGFEMDELDRLPSVEYMITISDTGEFIGATRVVPTTGPHLLAGPLSYFVQRPYERSADVWELTRYIPCEDEEGEPAIAGRAYMTLAFVEWSMRRGVKHLLGISPEATIAFASRMGWGVRLLGMPQEYEDRDRGLAVSYDFQPTTLATTRRFWEISTVATYEAPPVERCDPISLAEIAALDADDERRSIEFAQAVAAAAGPGEASASAA